MTKSALVVMVVVVLLTQMDVVMVAGYQGLDSHQPLWVVYLNAWISQIVIFIIIRASY